MCAMSYSVEPIDYNVKFREPMYYLSDLTRLTRKNAVEAGKSSKCTLTPPPPPLWSNATVCELSADILTRLAKAREPTFAPEMMNLPRKARLRNCNRLRQQ